MPRRAAPGDRASLEAALSPTLRAALEELRVIHDVDDWQRSTLGPGFQQAACLRHAAALVARDGLDPDVALDRAAEELGLSPFTIRTRADRWPAESRGSETHYASSARELVSAMVDHASTTTASEKAS